jgi:LuxR family quorum sensing-dependent transcriptional regulator
MSWQRPRGFAYTGKQVGFMVLDEALLAIESATTIDQLKTVMQRIAESYGFASFNFIDAGRAYSNLPFYFGTTGARWESEYRGNNFIHIDPYIAKARRFNLPFDWESIPFPKAKRGPKSGIARLMDAASAHGYQEGLVVPHHFCDDIGRVHSTVCVFYWQDKPSEFTRFKQVHRHQMHLLVIYFMQRSMEILALEKRGDLALIGARAAARDSGTMRLTDRERDVLSWAGRGKTTLETATILTLSDLTVETHMRNALAKLGAQNKTHGVAKCISLGLIDI